MKVECTKKYVISNPFLTRIVYILLHALIFFLLVQPNNHLYADDGFSSSQVDIVVDGTIGSPASYALEKIRQVFNGRGISLNIKDSIDETRSPFVILIGTLEGSNRVKELKKSGRINLSSKKESLAVKHIIQDNKDLYVIAGADDRGLMYALLEIANKIEFLPKDARESDAFEDKSESPHVPVRSMAVFLHSRDDERDWYYSKEYWEEYFAMLAGDRWNAFNLVFSHQTPYLAPMYPFHVKVDKYPEVKVSGLTDVQREENLEMLQFISSLARDRGLDFTLSVWQQIAWGRDTHTRSQESMVSGYNKENMTDYTYLALSKLLKECPGITGLQLRLNYESGVSYAEQEAFFRDAVFRAAKETGRPILIEVRDIGLLSETLDAARATGLPVRVSHKYWAEHLMFPYHPAKFVWTYSYGDWLRYPRNADHIYQVWSLGSHRLLLWGDPEFVRRFAPTTTFEDAVGFEICAPLSQKGYGNAPGAWRIFREPDREYYKWEFQKYWSYYRLFGRLTYNPDTGDEVWTDELDRRFGREASAAIGRVYRSASQVLPLIAGIAIGNYNMGSWPEKDMGGLINYYLTLKPYDRARFRGFLEYVDDVLAGRSSGRMNPLDVAFRLEAIALEIDTALDKAYPLVRNSEKEFWASDKDFRILSGMARYHAQKMRAATSLGFFYRTGDIGQIRQSIRHAEIALEIWKDLSARGDEIYTENLVFGPGSVGHWKDNIQFVEDDLKQLKYQEKLFQTTQNVDYAFDFGPSPLTGTTSTWSTSYTNDYSVEPRFRGISPSSQFDPALGFGWIEAQDLSALELKSINRYVWSGARSYESDLPGEALLGDFIQGSGEAVFRIDLPEGHYQGTVIVTDRTKNSSPHGPMSVTVVERFGDRPIIDRKIVRSGETIIKRFNINMTGERYTTFRIKFSADPDADYIVNALMFTRVEPHISHIPVHNARPEQSIKISACVTLPPPPNDEHLPTSLGVITSNASTLDIPSQVVRVTLKYKPERGEVFRAMNMSLTEDSIYTVSLPAEDVKTGKILYYFEAEDSTGRVVRFPEENAAPLYSSIDVTDDQTAPEVKHLADTNHSPGRPMEIKATVSDESDVRKVLLYYRQTRQTMEYTVVTMDREGDNYVATIPGRAITKDFDIMYYFEAFDEHGNACLYPNPDVTQPYFVVRVDR